MPSIVMVYDNSIPPASHAHWVTGRTLYGDILLRRESVKETFRKWLAGVFPAFDFWELSPGFDENELAQKILAQPHGTIFLHYFSCFLPQDDAAAKHQLAQAVLRPAGCVAAQDGEAVFYSFPGRDKYIRFLQQNPPEMPSIMSPAFCSLANEACYIRYITGGFDARHCNTVEEDGGVVVKSSKNMAKIKAEYSQYYLLPQAMRQWFVQPFGYEEKNGVASYKMQRCLLPDLGLRWVHGALDVETFTKVMDTAFRFLAQRSTKPVSLQQAAAQREALYLNKVRSRLEGLEEHGIEHRVGMLLSRYTALYHRMEPMMDGEAICVAGHGDFCFSNMLCSKDGNQLLLIDPKGALEEAQLWTDAYYDVAKLSHSVCGLYDFITLVPGCVAETEDGYALAHHFNNTAYVRIFRRFCEQAGYNFLLVRLYEASLFLSMLPLHAESPAKQAGFLLTAGNILDEIEAALAGGTGGVA